MAKPTKPTKPKSASPDCCQPPPTHVDYYHGGPRCKGGNIIGPYPLGSGGGPSHPFPPGPITPTIIPGEEPNSSQLGVELGVTVTFDKPCGCCVYRQCIRGYAARQKKGSDKWSPLINPTIPPDSYGEDTGSKGEHYGHRSDHSTDPTNGYVSKCVFQMTDAPGIPNPNDGYTYMFRLEFLGVIFDACRQVTVGQSSWVIQTPGAAPLPGPVTGDGKTHSAEAAGQNDAKMGGEAMAQTHGAQILVGPESLDASVWRYGVGEQSLTIAYSHPSRPSATAVADLQVTLFLKDGTRLQPPPDDLDLKYLDGFARGNWITETSLYNLQGVDLTQISEVQVAFRGQQSERVPLEMTRPIERLAR